MVMNTPMKAIYRIIIAAAATVAAAACANVEEMIPADRQSLLSGQGENAPVTFTASVGIDSKTSIDEDRKVSWAAGDVITVFDAEGRSEAFTVEEDCASYSFTSTGTLGDGPYYAVAGYGEDTPSFDKDGRQIGTLGLLGPMRLDYAKFIPYLEYFSSRLTELLTEQKEGDSDEEKKES